METTTLFFRPCSRTLCSDAARIVPKLDYWSAVFKDCSMMEIAQLFHVEQSMPEFLSKCLKVPTVQMQYFSYHWNGLKFFVPEIALVLCSPQIDRNDEAIFQVTFPSIKLDISGDGLDFLRQHFKGLNFCDFSVDQYLRLLGSPLDKVYFGKCSVTRCDFAFDLVDYKGEFLDDCITYINAFRELSGNKQVRLSCGGIPSGLAFSIKDGLSQKTLYLGNTSSDCFLRIYDKKMEYCDEQGAFKKPCPYGESINSWIRIELQLRRTKAQSVLYGSPKADFHTFFLGVFRFVFERYAFIDKDYCKTSPSRKVESFWSDLFDWETITRLICNSHFVQFTQDPVKKLDHYILKQVRNPLLLFFGLHGIDAGLLMLSLSLDQESRDRSSPDFDKSLCASLSYAAFVKKALAIQPLEKYKGLYIDPNTKSVRLLLPDHLLHVRGLA